MTGLRVGTLQHNVGLIPAVAGIGAVVVAGRHGYISWAVANPVAFVAHLQRMSSVVGSSTRALINIGADARMVAADVFDAIENINIDVNLDPDFGDRTASNRFERSDRPTKRQRLIDDVNKTPGDATMAQTFSQPSGGAMKSFGGTLVGGGHQHQDKTKFVKASAAFFPRRVGATDDNQFCLIGVLNPIDCLNAQRVVAGTDFEQWGSGFITTPAGASATVFHQWDAPNAVTQEKAQAEYHGLHVKDCKFAVHFENGDVGNTHKVHIWYKSFLPGSHEHLNNTTTHNNGEAAEGASLRGIIGESAGGEGFAGTSREAYNRLMTTAGMRHIVLGSATTNGMSSTGSFLIDWDIGKVRAMLGDMGLLAWDDTLKSYFSSHKNMHFGLDVQDVTEAFEGSSMPLTLIWAMTEVTGGDDTEVLFRPIKLADNLVVRGMQELSLQFFDRKVRVTADMPSDIL